MLRLVAAALAAILAFPACAGSVELASLPLGNASSGLVPRAVCELPADPASQAHATVPAPGPAMTLPPRLLQAIRVDADIPAD